MVRVDIQGGHHCHLGVHGHKGESSGLSRGRGRRPNQWPEGPQPSAGTRNKRAKHIVITILLYYDVDYIQYELCTSFSTDAQSI